MSTSYVFVFVFTVVLVGVGLWGVSKVKEEDVTFYTGLAFVLYGLVLSLYAGKIFDIHNADELKTIGDTFLIISSIGANLVAASILLPKIKNSVTCEVCVKCGEKESRAKPEESLKSNPKKQPKKV